MPSTGSDTQRLRVSKQTYTTMEIPGAERERDGKTFQHLEQARDTCDGDAPATKAATRIV